MGGRALASGLGPSFALHKSVLTVRQRGLPFRMRGLIHLVFICDSVSGRGEGVGGAHYSTANVMTSSFPHTRASDGPLICVCVFGGEDGDSRNAVEWFERRLQK